MTVERIYAKGNPHHFGAAKVLLFLFAELLLINALRHIFGFECYKEDLAFCSVAKNALLAAYGTAGALILVAVFAKHQLAALFSEAGLRLRPFSMNIAGLLLLTATLPVLRSELPGFLLGLIAIVWIIGVSLLLVGSVLMVAPGSRWKVFLQTGGIAFLPVMLAGALAPLVAMQARSVWQGDVLSGWTFEMVLRVMEWWGQPVQTLEGSKIIGSQDFMINVAPSCSGIEGLALTTIFSLIYLTFFREDLRFPRALIILPIGLCLSWLLKIF